jgi:uncharacterized ferredoxin-like protein
MVKPTVEEIKPPSTATKKQAKTKAKAKSKDDVIAELLQQNNESQQQIKQLIELLTQKK